MRTITREELDKILINHQHWLNEDCDGWEDMRADLYNADLRNADLYNANLRSADLRNADLRDADLRNANLRNANLRNADLCNADLRDADLCNANLRNADLRNANLRNADLHNANLRNANLCNANLRNANLHNADLCNADLRNADLCNANLRSADLCNANLHNADLCNADLRNADNIPFVPIACPDTGEFVAWKKAKGLIIKLFIPSEAKRLSATGKKCRCDKARVLAIENIDGTPTDLTEVKSDYDSDFVYKVGEIVSVNNFCEDRWRECSEGIHFFINRQEAADY